MDPMHIWKKNRNLYYLITFFDNSFFPLAIWYFYFTGQLGLSPALTGILGATPWIIDALLEIPTGSIADRYGRKRVYIFSQLILAASFLPVIYSRHLLLLFAGQIFVGISMAISNGCVAPVVKTAFDATGLKDHEFDSFLGRKQSFVFIARVIATPVGALLYVHYPRLPYQLTAVLLALAAVAALWLTDEVDYTERRTVKSRLHISEALNAIRQTSLLLRLLVGYLLIQIFAETFWNLYQPFFREYGFSVSLIGFMYTGVSIASIAGAVCFARIARNHSLVSIQNLIGILSLATGVLGLVLGPYRILAPLIMGIGSGMAFPVLNSAFLKAIPEKYQSTGLSVVSLVTLGTFGVSQAATGILLDFFAPSKIMFYTACLLGIFLSLLILSDRSKKLSNA